MWKQLIPAFRITLFLTVLTGLIYPAVITGLCQVLFRSQANGSIISVDGKQAGSALIGQNFTKPEYLHPRPSAAGSGYDGTASSGSNYGPTNAKLIDRTKAGVAAFRKENPQFTGELPADAVTASASGLDPHISPASAIAQAERIAKARGVSTDRILQILSSGTESRDLGFLGEPRVNVLRVNIALDGQLPLNPVRVSLRASTP